MAANYIFGLRMNIAETAGAGSWGTPFFSAPFMAMSDDWTDDPFTGMARKQWTFTFPPTLIDADTLYRIYPEVWVARMPMPVGGSWGAVQFWVGNYAGNNTPSETNNSDGQAIFQVIELPAELIEIEDGMGTYPSSSSSEEEE